MKVSRHGRVALITLLVVMLLGGSASGLEIFWPTVHWTMADLSVSDILDEKDPSLDGKLVAFEADGRVVLLIDEIDKADIEFPNDLLQELDRMAPPPEIGH
mgnify:CR=1 FL=1